MKNYDIKCVDVFLPDDVINIIMKWYLHFIRFEMTERYNIFYNMYNKEWKLVCEYIRTNVPRYEIHFDSGDVFSVSSRECEPLYSARFFIQKQTFAINEIKRRSISLP
jgi:hypothetical protein